MPNEGQTERELNRAPGTGYTGKNQFSLGWGQDVLHTSSKIRGDEPLTWEWFTGEDEQIHQDLLQQPTMLQSSVRLALAP